MKHGKFLLPPLLALFACAPVGPDAPTADVPAIGPVLGAADGFDIADRECNVVLRSVTRAVDADGRPGTFCPGFSTCWMTFEAIVEIADAVDGVPQVLYRNRADFGDWYSSNSAYEIEGAADGFRRYRVMFAEAGVRDGMSATAYERTDLDLIAYVNDRGSRLFDHNDPAYAGDFDALVLNGRSSFEFSGAPVCGGDTVTEESAYADRSCDVILRKVGRAREADGRPATTCGATGCFLTFAARVDVPEGSPAPGLRYRNASDRESVWFESFEATAIENSPFLFQSYEIRFAVGGVRDGVSARAIESAILEMVAFVDLTDGRAYDHNERPGDLENLFVHGSDDFRFEARRGLCGS